MCYIIVWVALRTETSATTAAVESSGVEGLHNIKEGSQPAQPSSAQHDNNSSNSHTSSPGYSICFQPACAYSCILDYADLILQCALMSLWTGTGQRSWGWGGVGYVGVSAVEKFGLCWQGEGGYDVTGERTTGREGGGWRICLALKYPFLERTKQSPQEPCVVRNAVFLWWRTADVFCLVMHLLLSTMPLEKNSGQPL